MADYGYVYCLSNPAMPGIFKVGKTERSVALRAAELSGSTSVPSSFRVLFYFETNETGAAERSAHEHLEEYRMSRNREFFMCDPRSIHNVFCELMPDGFAFSHTDKWDEMSDSLDYEDWKSSKESQGLDAQDLEEECGDGQNKDG